MTGEQLSKVSEGMVMRGAFVPSKIAEPIPIGEDGGEINTDPFVIQPPIKDQTDVETLLQPTIIDEPYKSLRRTGTHEPIPLEKKAVSVVVLEVAQVPNRFSKAISMHPDVYYPLPQEGSDPTPYLMIANPRDAADRGYSGSTIITPYQLNTLGILFGMNMKNRLATIKRRLLKNAA